MTDALLTTTLPAKGIFGDDPRLLGVAGGYITGTGRTLVNNADCVAAFGAGLNGYTTDRNSLFPRAQIIHCDVDTSVIGRHRAAAVSIHGDALLAATRLHDIIVDRAPGAGCHWR